MPVRANTRKALMIEKKKRDQYDMQTENQCDTDEQSGTKKCKLTHHHLEEKMLHNYATTQGNVRLKG